MDQEASLTLLAYKRVPLYVVACGLLLAVMVRVARQELPRTERLHPQESCPEHSPAGEGFSVTVLSSAGSIIVSARDIELVRAAENYVEICLASGKQYLHRATLSSLQKPLEAEGLVRVHRSTIVNVRFLQRRLSHRRLKMRSGRIVQVSRKYCTALQETLAKQANVSLGGSIPD
jgi:DNA-binding LytR/AlgR family response regulator